LIASGGCSTIDNTGSGSTLIPSQTLNISNALRIPVESFVAGALLFVIIDPLAPNWHIEQTRLGETRFRIALRKKRFTTGGDGEAVPAFYRRAEQIANALGSGGRYRVIEYSEGIDSDVLVARRVAQGVVEIIREGLH
jgi:hypothetical protein